MKQNKRMILAIVALAGIFVVIIDVKTAIYSVRDGIEICIETVIPSLFPFIILSHIINNELMGRKFPWMKPLRYLCAIPAGTESLFLLGFICGYPIGAQCIDSAYRQGQLKKKDAHRMLGFCNNAGPSFIFGVGSVLFSSKLTLLAVWGIHVFSAMIVGMVLPGRNKEYKDVIIAQNESANFSMIGAAKTMACICCWIIVFKILLGFLARWFLWLLPIEWQVAVSGLFELANGCTDLVKIYNENIRFVIFSTILGFGGVCVYLQTVSVTENLGTGLYFPGKVLQASISFLLSSICQVFIFPYADVNLLICAIIVLTVLVLPYIVRNLKFRK